MSSVFVEDGGSGGEKVVFEPTYNDQTLTFTIEEKTIGEMLDLFHSGKKLYIKITDSHGFAGGINPGTYLVIATYEHEGAQGNPGDYTFISYVYSGYLNFNGTSLDEHASMWCGD